MDQGISLVCKKFPGVKAGKPVLFIRTHLWNLFCSRSHNMETGEFSYFVEGTSYLEWYSEMILSIKLKALSDFNLKQVGFGERCFFSIFFAIKHADFCVFSSIQDLVAWLFFYRVFGVSKRPVFAFWQNLAHGVLNNAPLFGRFR